MPKYRFHELRRSNESLPEDVNAPVEQVAARFNDVRLIEKLQVIREKKLYGTAAKVDKYGRVLAEFDFQHGMCPRFKLVEYEETTIFERSIHNDNLDMRKDTGRK